ncbi:MAG: ureidoglycolate lyase, partial [Pseudomonadota bacterium]
MATEIAIEKLTREAFAPFGDVLEIGTIEPFMINRGMCARYSDLADLDFDTDSRLGISIFDAKAYDLPLLLDMMERHPDGSQAFLPTTHAPFLVIVADDNEGTPATPRAFMSAPGQGVNYHRG